MKFQMHVIVIHSNYIVIRFAPPPAVPMETAPPGVTPGAEEGPRLGPAPAPQSPPTHVLRRAPAPAAALAPTHDPGPKPAVESKLSVRVQCLNLNWCVCQQVAKQIQVVSESLSLQVQVQLALTCQETARSQITKLLPSVRLLNFHFISHFDH